MPEEMPQSMQRMPSLWWYATLFARSRHRKFTILGTFSSIAAASFSLHSPDNVGICSLTDQLGKRRSNFG